MGYRTARRRTQKLQARRSLLAGWGLCEPLESRCLLSGSLDYVILPDLPISPSFTTAPAAPEATTTKLVAFPSGAQLGDTVLFRAGIQPGAGATGTVSFMDGSARLRTAAVDTSGQAALSVSLPIGVHTVMAEYSGNELLAGCTSAPLSLPVDRVGAQLVKDIYTWAPSSDTAIQNIVDVNGTLFFTTSDPTNGEELWKTDGTDARTVLVKDINPGLASSFPANLTNIDGMLYFAATDGVNGAELWKSDGTAAGTILIQDIVVGIGGSSPGNLTIEFRKSNVTLLNPAAMAGRTPE